MYVYVVTHEHTDGRWSICGIWCTQAQAVHRCKTHPPEDNLTAVRWTRVPLWGFPWLWLVGGLLFILGAALVLL